MAMVGDMRLITAAMVTGRIASPSVDRLNRFLPHLFPALRTTILEQLQFAFHHGRVQNLQLYYIRTIHANNNKQKNTRPSSIAATGSLPPQSQAERNATETAVHSPKKLRKHVETTT